MTKTRKTILVSILSALILVCVMLGVMPFVKTNTAYASEWTGPVTITESTTISDVTIKDQTSLSKSAYTIEPKKDGVSYYTITFNNVTFENISSNYDKSTNVGGACVYVSSKINADVEINFINCKFIGCNCSNGYGGAIYVDNSGKNVNLNFNNCVVDNCNAYYGGFIYVDNDNTRLYGNGTTVINGCDSTKNGGAIYVNWENFVLDGFNITNSKSNNDGGVVFLSVTSYNPIFNNCNFYDNYGYVLYFNETIMDRVLEAVISNCTFYNNAKDGSTFYDLMDSNDTDIIDCTFICDEPNCETKNHIYTNKTYINDTNLIGVSHEKSEDYKLTKASDGKYHIGNSADMFKFYLDVSRGNTFENETVSLDSDVTAYNRIGVWAEDSSAKTFKGTFGGNGYSVTLNLLNGASNNALFSFTIGATIKDVEVYGKVKGGSGASGIVAHAEDTEIINCANHADVEGYNYVGGIVGYAKDNTNIYNSANYGNMTGDNQVGGIAGYMKDGEIFNCYNEGSITANTWKGGDIIGNNSDDTTSVKSCFVKGNTDIVKTLNGNIDNSVSVFGKDVDVSGWRYWKDNNGIPQHDNFYKVNDPDIDYSITINSSERVYVKDRVFDFAKMPNTTLTHVFEITGETTNVTFENVVFKNIDANGNGTCVYVSKNLANDLVVTFDNCQFINCGNADGYGGAIYVDNSGKKVDLFFTHSVIDGCYAKEGGFLYAYNDNTKTYGNGSTIIKNCKATNNGGAFFLNGDYSDASGFTFMGNRASYGGALYINQDNITVKNCVFYENKSTSYGSAVFYAMYVSSTIDGCTFYQNKEESGRHYEIDINGNNPVKDCVFICGNDGCSLDKHINEMSGVTDCSVVKTSSYTLTKGKDDKYRITDSADWIKFELDVSRGKTFENETVVLESNVTAYNRIGVWANDGTEKVFKGTFDGRGHTVTLCLGNDGNGNAIANNALFSYTVGATVKNLFVYGYVIGKDGVGGIIAHAENTTVINCENHANIIGSGSYAGGLVGWGRDINIYNSANYGRINGGKEVGGIIGRINGSGNIDNCYNAKAVTATAGNKGDFIGYNGGTATATHCYTNIIKDVLKKLNDSVGQNAEWLYWADNNGTPELTTPYVYYTFNEESRTLTQKEARAPKDAKFYTGGEMKTGWYIVKNDIITNDRINVSGDVHLILVGTLNAKQGINVQDDNCLSIYATAESPKGGSVIATGGKNNAGIGGENERSGGTVYIYGGTVAATGGTGVTGRGVERGGAGIGGGVNDDGGTTYIYGGSVSATGGENGAGIGGGYDGNGGTTYIYSGKVIANGKGGGKGIGGGSGKDGGVTDVYGGEITCEGYNGIGGTFSFICCDAEMTSDGESISAYSGQRQISIFNTKLNHKLSKTYEEVLPSFDQDTQILTYGHKTYYECECGKYYEKYEDGILGDEILDLESWLNDDKQGLIGKIPVNVTFTDGKTVKTVTALKWTVLPYNQIWIPKDDENTYFMGWQYFNGEKWCLFDETVIVMEDLEVFSIRMSLEEILQGEDQADSFILNEETGVISGIYIVRGGGNEIKNRMNVKYGAVIILPDDTKVTFTQGIRVASGAKLFIVGKGEKGNGMLKANALDNSAAIDNGGGGKVYIYGGKVVAYGGENGAGIGGGNHGNNGTIYIYGGTVAATSGGRGAGIGGGYQGDGGIVYIYGGNVTATGVAGGAGIGGGYQGIGGTIYIYGGNVTADGGVSGAGIGGGDSGGGGVHYIYGGTIIATGGRCGAGIGGGMGQRGATMYIYGGNVTAIGGEKGAGIGGGEKGSGKYVHIFGGSITATGNGGGADFGGGAGANAHDQGTLDLYDKVVKDGNKYYLTPTEIKATCTESGCKPYYFNSLYYCLNAECTLLIGDGSKEAFDLWKSDEKGGYVKPLGHDYQTEYAWNKDECTAHYYCTHGCKIGEVTEKVTAKLVTDTPATCTAKAKGHYKVTFTNALFSEQNSESFEYGDLSEHEFKNYVSDNNATCTSDGTKTSKCSYCEATDTITDEGSKLNHNYDVTYTWNKDECTARYYCTHGCGIGEVTEKVTGKFVEDTKATCTEKAKGHYKATFTKSLFDVQETKPNTVEDGEPLGHNFVNYVCERCKVEDLISAKADSKDAIDTFVNGNTDRAVTNLLVLANAEIYSKDANTIAKIFEIRDYWLTTFEKLLGTTHEHTFETEWTYTDTYHWHEATCKHDYFVASDFDTHTFNGGVKVGNKTTYTCTCCGYSYTDYSTFENTESEVISETIKFKGYSLTLSSDISINFYMNLTEEQALNGEMKFIIGDRVITVIAGYNANGYYFRCPLNTLEIATTVKAEFTYMNATVIKEYSVMDYVNTVVENKEGKYDEKLIALCKSIANYGYYAQIELEDIHDGVTIGNDGYKEMCHYGTLDVESAKSGLQVYGFTDDKKNTNIIGVGRSLSLDDKVAMNIYIQVKDGYTLTKDMISVSDDKEFILSQVEKNQYRITVLDIETTNLGTNYTIIIDGESITTSVLSYANKVVNGSFTDSNKNAMTALYEYYLKAKAYKGI